jgi:hypothetical protein
MLVLARGIGHALNVTVDRLQAWHLKAHVWVHPDDEK